MKRKVPGLDPNFTPGRVPGILTLTISPKWGMYLKRWQGPRKVPLTALQIAVIEQFKQAAQIVKNCSAQDYEAARDLSVGTPFLPRDLLMKAAYGKLIEVTLTDGTFIQGVRMANEQAQQLLDSICTDIGALLVRTSSGWACIEPGTVDQVLTAQGAGNPPTWSAGPLGSSLGAASEMPQPSSTDGNGSCFKGNVVTPIFDMLLTTLYPAVHLVPGDVYRGYCLEISSGHIAAVTQVGTDYTAPAGGGDWLGFQATSGIVLQAGHQYALGVSDRSQGDSYALPMYDVTYFQPGIPSSSWASYVYLAKHDPQVGDAISIGSSGKLCVGIAVRW